MNKYLKAALWTVGTVLFIHLLLVTRFTFVPFGAQTAAIEYDNWTGNYKIIHGSGVYAIHEKK